MEKPQIRTPIWKNIPLLAGVIMLFVGLWAAYWAIRLRRDGYFITTTVISVTPQETELDGKKAYLVSDVTRVRKGDEFKYSYETPSPPAVGSSMSGYIWTSGSDRGGISGSWYYPWLLPIITLSAAGIIFAIYARFKGKWQCAMAVAAFVVTTIVIMLEPLQRTLEIRDYLLTEPGRFNQRP